MTLYARRARHLICLGGLVIVTAAANAADANRTLEEIVVTATKRTESIQDVPVSVSVETGQNLVDRGQSQLADYAAYIPGFNISNGGSPGLSAVTLRGISSVTATSAVATYLDDTPVGASSAWANANYTMLDLLPYDLDRLEVLRGPQGTLYGAGAMGGLIKYVMNSPSTTEYAGVVGIEGFSIDGAGSLGYGVSGRFSAPLIPNVLGVSFSVFDKHTPGWMTNLETNQTHTNDVGQSGGRVALQWTPSENLTIKLSALHSVTNSHDVALRQYTTSVPAPNAGTGLLVIPRSPLPDGTENVAFLSPYNQTLNYYSSTIDWNAGAFDVISATSWSSQRSFQGLDITQQLGSIFGSLGGTGPGLADFYSTFGLDKLTQEFRLVSPQGQTVDWLVGLFYTHEASTNSQYGLGFNLDRTPNASFPQPLGWWLVELPEIYDEYAMFGDVTWNVTQNLSLTAGGRYAKNDQDWNTTVAPTPLDNEHGFFHVGTHEGVATWMADAEYHFAKNLMMYARGASGYRPGGPNSPVAGIPVVVGSDSLVNYEIGVKSTFLDGRAQIDAGLFYIDWNNIQLNATNTQGITYNANGGKAVSKGVEFAGTYSPLDGMQLGLNYAYTDAHLKSVIPDASYLVTGVQLPNVPKQSVSVTIGYEWQPLQDWKARLNGGYRYVGKQYLSILESPSGSSTPTVEAPGYSVIDLNAFVRKDHVTLKAYVRNLTHNDAVTAGSYQGPVITNSMTGNRQLLATYLQPRTIGIGVDYAF